MMKEDIHSTLSRLDLVIGRASNCHFNNPASGDAIQSFEKRKGIRLPESYKLFLAYTNGGMIVDDHLEQIIKRDGDLETAKWNAHYFLSLEELEQKYDDMDSWNFGGAELAGRPYPFIPFFSTSVNEYLVFVAVSNDKPESPVFDAFHEETVYSWGMVTSDFNKFLINYLDSSGRPEVLGDVEKGMASDYLALRTETEDKVETPQEIIKRTTIKLNTDPTDDWAFMERGMAFVDTGNYEAAIEDFNASISLAGDDPFYYFKRSELFSQLGKQRAALIDIDIAVKLKPDDLLYLSLRADALQAMKKYEAALKDVNEVIQADNTYLLAYLTREEIYRALGETAKADQDAQRIKELVKNE